MDGVWTMNFESQLKVPLYSPAAATVSRSQLTEFLRYCETMSGRVFADYGAFDQFAVQDFRQFWRLFLCWSEISQEGEIDPVCGGESLEGARFFPHLRLNYAENILSGAPERPAVTGCHSGGRHEHLTRGELRAKVVRLAGSLSRLGLRPGDRIVAIARNNIEVVVAALASATVGATFSSCPPDMGAFAILARFSPLKPSMLMGNLRTEPWDTGLPVSARLAEVALGLPSLQLVIALDDGAAPDGLAAPMHRFTELTTGSGDQVFAWTRYAFNHPLFILFSSGTTGSPKCIVHGAGGTLIEHAKEHRLHCDLRAGDKLFFQTSCGWMMWNWQLSALASGAELVLYDGPLEGPETLWRLVANEGVTVFGTSAAFLQFCEGAGFSPGRKFALPALRSMLSTGSILYPRQYDWVKDHVKALPLQSISGGTDIIGCFVLGNPNLPVYRGQAQCRSLGLDVRALSPAGAANASAGELVCVNPFPSCPLGFYTDADGGRFHEAYFSQNPGVWTHGDLVEATPEGGWLLHGRSDGVINIRGIRVGSAEIYAALQDIDEITEALAVEQQATDEPGGTRLILLVVLRKGTELSSALTERVRSQLVRRGSPALVPAVVAQVGALPVTYSGKPSEAAARDAVNGQPVRNRDALRNPDCLEAIAKHPALQASSRSSPRTPHVGDLRPGGSLEQDLQSICEDVLRVARVGWSDDLLELGGDSLTVLNLFLAFQQYLKQDDLSLAALFSSRTIERFAAFVRRTSAGSETAEPARQPGPHIRPAGPEDVGPLCQFLYEAFKEGGVSATAWQRLFDYEWFDEKPNLGFILAHGDEIVGFLGTVYARRQIGSTRNVVCNLTSWYVRPDYRGWGTALLAAATRDDGISYTALTPGPLSRQVFMALGFQRLDEHRIVMPLLLDAETLHKPRPVILFDPGAVRRSLNEQQQRTYDDHAPYDCLQLVLIAGSERVYIVVKRRTMSLRRLHRWFLADVRFPYSEVLHCSAPPLLAQHLEHVRLAVLRRQRTLALVADQRLFPVRPRGILKSDHTFYRSPLLDAGTLDKLYSELVLLPV